MMRVPIAGGVEEEVYDGVGDSLVEFSGVEIVGDRMFFFAHDTGGPAAERQLYSVELGAGTGLAVGGTLAVRSHGIGPFERPCWSRFRGLGWFRRNGF